MISRDARAFGALDERSHFTPSLKGSSLGLSGSLKTGAFVTPRCYWMHDALTQGVSWRHSALTARAPQVNRQRSALTHRVGWAVSGPSEEGQRRPLTTNNDHHGPASVAGPSVRLPSYTQVSSHIRDRHESIGIAVPVYRGQK